MDCIEIRAGFVGYIDGDLSGDERLRVELHVAECYDCREELDEMGRLLELSDAALKHPCPVDRFEDLKARLPDAEPAPIPMPSRPRFRVREVLLKLAVAAMVIALIAASPILINGARRLFTPIEGTTALGNGAVLARDLLACRDGEEERNAESRELHQLRASGSRESRDRSVAVQWPGRSSGTRLDASSASSMWSNFFEKPFPHHILLLDLENSRLKYGLSVPAPHFPSTFRP